MNNLLSDHVSFGESFRFHRKLLSFGKATADDNFHKMHCNWVSSDARHHQFVSQTSWNKYLFLLLNSLTD